MTINHLIVGVYCSYMGIACFVIPSAGYARFKMGHLREYRESTVIPVGIMCVWISGLIVAFARLVADQPSGIAELIGATGITAGGILLTHGLGSVIAGRHTTWIAVAVVLLLFVGGTWGSMEGLF